MLWINFLHLYQPAHADPYIVEEAAENSYRRLLRVLEDNPEVNFTFNISGCLVLSWKEAGYTDIIEGFKKLLARGQIEITGSAAYHPLLPLVPAKEARSQIRENSEILKDVFGDKIQLRGFFFPEMAYGEKVAKLVKEEGFEWIILDELAYNGVFDRSPASGEACLDNASGLKTIFRNRILSSDYVPRAVWAEMKKGEKEVLVTGTDGELYGLRHKDESGKLRKVLRDKRLSTSTISSYLKEQKELERKELKSCSWDSTEEDLRSGSPYFLWFDKENKIHQDLWSLARLAYDISDKYRDDENHFWTRWHLKRGLASCGFWWASAKDFTHVFGPYAWNPDEIERGVNELIRSVRSVEDKRSEREKVRAEKLYIRIKKRVWHRHWTYYWHKI